MNYKLFVKSRNFAYLQIRTEPRLTFNIIKVFKGSEFFVENKYGVAIHQSTLGTLPGLKVVSHSGGHGETVKSIVIDHPNRTGNCILTAAGWAGDKQAYICQLHLHLKKSDVAHLFDDVHHVWRGAVEILSKPVWEEGVYRLELDR